MNNEIQPFEFEGNKVRALADGDEVMFVASDIAKILGYRDAANLARNLDDDERGIHEVSTPSGTQNMTVLTESGLYRSILNREIAYVKEPEAQAFVKRFQRWVTHEVLPQIRKTGGYIPAGDADSDEDIMARAVLVAQKTIERKNQQLQAKDAQIRELEPRLKRLMISRTWKTGCLFAMRQRSCRTPEPPSRKNSCASGWPTITGFSNPVALGVQPQSIALRVIS